MTDDLIRLAALAIAAPGGPEGVAAVLEALHRAQALDAAMPRVIQNNEGLRGPIRSNGTPPPGSRVQ